MKMTKFCFLCGKWKKRCMWAYIGQSKIYWHAICTQKIVFCQHTLTGCKMAESFIGHWSIKKPPIEALPETLCGPIVFPSFLLDISFGPTYFGILPWPLENKVINSSVANFDILCLVHLVLLWLKYKFLN